MTDIIPVSVNNFKIFLLNIFNIELIDDKEVLTAISQSFGLSVSDDISDMQNNITNYMTIDKRRELRALRNALDRDPSTDTKVNLPAIYGTAYCAIVGCPDDVKSSDKKELTEQKYVYQNINYNGTETDRLISLAIAVRTSGQGFDEFPDKYGYNQIIKDIKDNNLPWTPVYFEYMNLLHNKADGNIQIKLPRALDISRHSTRQSSSRKYYDTTPYIMLIRDYKNTGLSLQNVYDILNVRKLRYDSIDNSTKGRYFLNDHIQNLYYEIDYYSPLKNAFEEMIDDSGDTVLLKPKSKQLIKDYDALSKYRKQKRQDSSTNDLLKSFFHGMKINSDADPCNNILNILNNRDRSNYHDWECTEFKNRLKKIGRNDVITAFLAYTESRTYRYINQYIRNRQTIEDVEMEGYESDNKIVEYDSDDYEDYSPVEREVIKEKLFRLHPITQQLVAGKGPPITQELILKYIDLMNFYFNDFRGRFIVNKNNFYVVRGTDIKTLGLQLNKSVLVQGFSSTTTNVPLASQYINSSCCIMILHVLPGVSYAAIHCVLEVEENEIVLQNNLFYTLRGSVDCSMYENSYLFALVDVSTNILESFNDSYHESTTSMCYKIPPNAYNAFEKSLLQDLEKLKTSELKEICRSMSINSEGSKYDLILSIQMNAQLKMKKNCILQELETLYCALMGHTGIPLPGHTGCLKDDYDIEKIILTEDLPPYPYSTKRRKRY